MANLVASVVPDELTIFNDLEKETLKLDRSILQQSETTGRLQKIKEKLERKMEKEKLKSAHLENQLKSLLNANRMSKENLKTKRQSRCMSEEMIMNLERQLQLENINAENKIKGFKLTQNKYEDLWKNYEAVYCNMPHNVNKCKAEKDFNAANELISLMRLEVTSTKVQISKAHERKDLQIKKCALLIAEHMRVQKLEEELAILRERKEELVAEVAKLENDVMMSQTKKAADEIEQNQRKTRIKNLMNSLTNRTCDLQIMEFNHVAMEQIIEPQATMLDPMTLFDIEDTIDDTQDEIPDNAAEEVTMDINTMLLQQQDTIVPRVQEQQTRSPPRMQPVTTAPQQEDICVENSAMEITPAAEAAISSKTPPASNIFLEKVVAPEAIQSVAAVSEQLPAEPDVCALTLAEPMSEDEADCSQITMPPVDMQVEQHQILNSASQQEPSIGMEQLQPVAPIPIPAWDGTGSDVGGEVLSQGTESTTGSMTNLLDDDKRREYMRKLMATPTFSIPTADLAPGEEIENDPNLSAGNSAADQACLQNFYALLAEEGIDGIDAIPVELNSDAPLSITPSAPPQRQAPPAPVQLAVNPETPVINGDNSFMFPAASSTPAPNATGFGGFGSFFGSTPAQNSTSSFFGSAFGEAPAENGNSQPANSAFDFNFGGSAPSNQSFMNMF